MNYWFKNKQIFHDTCHQNGTNKIGEVTYGNDVKRLHDKTYPFEPYLLLRQ
jgi:hypothetical protein